VTAVDVRDVQGSVVGHRELPADLFEAPVNTAVMHQVVVAGAAAQRAGTHATRTRGQVSGGGVKPWRQKGTGRARQGSIRAPHWVGGGVSHGPQPRDHSKRVNKKMRKAALRSALSDALASGKVAVVEEIVFDGPRTKDAVSILTALELQGRVLLVLDQPDTDVELSFRNLSQVKIALPGNLGTFDVLFADRILFTGAAIDVLAGGEPAPRAPRAAAPEEAPAEDDTDDTENTKDSDEAGEPEDGEDS
jgi:large subunit ribosomal protein L4